MKIFVFSQFQIQDFGKLYFLVKSKRYFGIAVGERSIDLNAESFNQTFFVKKELKIMTNILLKQITNNWYIIISWIILALIVL